MFYLRALILCLPLALAFGPAAAQTAAVAFGEVKADPTLPVEVTADNLSVNQTDGSALFTGNVVVIQGEMRLSSDELLVIYKEDAEGKRGIERLEATGGVILVNGPDAAESQRADYTIDSGTVVMTGNVLLSQAGGTIAGDRLDVHLTDGTARMAGRVKTILNPDGDR
ncbi:LptA/OstA family protein [Roseobacteraceae bacterium NS-SX3]